MLMCKYIMLCHSSPCFVCVCGGGGGVVVNLSHPPPSGSVNQNICSYIISCWLARKRTDKFTFYYIFENL